MTPRYRSQVTTDGKKYNRNQEKRKMKDNETLDVAQHTEAHGDKIKGYKKLTEDQILAINDIKSAGQDLERLIKNLKTNDSIDLDSRWLEMGNSDLQVGMMKLTRAVAQPEFF